MVSYNQSTQYHSAATTVNRLLRTVSIDVRYVRFVTLDLDPYYPEQALHFPSTLTCGNGTYCRDAEQSGVP
jgi:hypothetical protein